MVSYIAFILVAFIGSAVMAGHWDSFHVSGVGNVRREAEQESSLCMAFGLSSCYP